jgi:hypothetical protein
LTDINLTAFLCPPTVALCLPAPADFSATSERLDSVVQDDVLLMKVRVHIAEAMLWVWGVS